MDSIKVGDRLVLSRSFAKSVLAALAEGQCPEVVRLKAIHDWEFGYVLQVERIDAPLSR